MSEREVELFEEHRPFLMRLASRITGNWSDAQELLTHAFLRWNETRIEEVENPKAFLATIVTRLAINHQRSARVRYEVAVEPEGVSRLSERAPENVGGLADALANALEIVLSRLSPLERAVFLLREVFQMDYAEVSGLLDESEANCRQILKRSRDKINSPQPRFAIAEHVCELALERFLTASRDGKLDDLMDLVAPGVVLIRDAGDIGLPSPAPLHGAEALAEHVRKYFARHAAATWSCVRIGEGYQLATLFGAAQQPLSAFICAIDRQQLVRVDHITCPTRLSMLLKLVGAPA
jgi:RNA polymerase sigma-70 factor (ECF subfamily)